MSDRAASPQKYLVMGGAGMLGYEIVRQLLDRGKDVRVLDLQPLADSRPESIVGDIRDPRAVERACRSFAELDTVIDTIEKEKARIIAKIPGLQYIPKDQVISRVLPGYESFTDWLLARCQPAA